MPLLILNLIFGSGFGSPQSFSVIETPHDWLTTTEPYKYKRILNCCWQLGVCLRRRGLVHSTGRYCTPWNQNRWLSCIHERTAKWLQRLRETGWIEALNGLGQRFPLPGVSDSHLFAGKTHKKTPRSTVGQAVGIWEDNNDGARYKE